MEDWQLKVLRITRSNCFYKLVDSDVFEIFSCSKGHSQLIRLNLVKHSNSQYYDICVNCSYTFLLATFVDRICNKYFRKCNKYFRKQINSVLFPSIRRKRFSSLGIAIGITCLRTPLATAWLQSSNCLKCRHPRLYPLCQLFLAVISHMV